MDEEINKMWSVRTMGCSGTMEKNEVLIRTTAWMDLENIMLNEGQEAQHSIRCHLYEMSRIGKYTEKVHLWLPRAGVREEGNRRDAE